MDADDFAGQVWLYEIWSSALLTLITATAPLFAAIANSASTLILAVGFAWLSLLFLRVADVGLIRGLVGGAVIFAVIAFGLHDDSLSPPGRASVPMTQIQAKSATLILNVHGVFGQALGEVLDAHSVAGTIIPAEAATRDALARNANAFAGTDLARLIADYNRQCSPEPAALAGAQHAATRDAYYAVGLLGGAGLGIPDESVSRLEQIKSAAVGAFWSVSGPLWAWMGVDNVTRAADQQAIFERRAQGTEALRAAGRGFYTDVPYSLPTQANWGGTYAGDSSAKAGYLTAADAPGDLAAHLAANAQAWGEGGRSQVIGLMPSNCVEAYQLAQWGAEQAYLALADAGKVATGGQRSSADSGLIGAAIAWQRMQQRVFNGGEVQREGIGNTLVEGASGALAGYQMLKNAVSWLDLNTLLPMYVAGMAGITWLVLIIAPIALLIAPLRGVQVILGWCSLLIFPLLCVVFAQLLSVAASLMIAGVSAQQAAAAAGWQGAGADLDLLRGALGGIAAVLLAVSTWLASSLTGVSISGLAGSAAGAVTTVSEAARAVASAVGFVTSGGRVERPRQGNDRQDNGGDGGEGGRSQSSGSGGGGVGGLGGLRRPASTSLSGVMSTIRELHKSTLDGMSKSSASDRQSNYQGMMRRKNEAAARAAQGDGISLVPPKGE